MAADTHASRHPFVWLLVLLPLAAHAARADDASALAIRNAVSQFLTVGGFADLNVSHSTRTGSTATAGEFDIYGTVHLSQNWSAQGEAIAVKDKEVRGVAEIQLERLYVAYVRSDALRVELGQIHTGIVQWNEREHRSRFLQTPIDVPGIARREERDGAWPLHFTGLWISGRAIGSLGFSYEVGVGTGRAHDRTTIGRFSASHPARTRLLTLGIAPESLRGWSFSAAALTDRIPASGQTLRERDFTLSTSYVRGHQELRAEWSVMRHETLNPRVVYVSRGWYVLASNRLRGRWQSLRPYVLIDRLSIDRREDYLQGAGDEKAVAVGLRWDPLRWLTWKVDVRAQNFPDGSGREHLVRTQFAFAF